MSGATLVLNIAYTLLISASLFRSLLRLRVALILGALGFVTYGMVEGNTTIAVWNALNAALHGFQLVKLLRARSDVELTDDEELIREKYFPGMSKFDFFAWWTLGRTEHLAGRLMTQGAPQDALLLILHGTATVEVDGEKIAVRGPGDFLGEVSLVRESTATATVTADDDLEVRLWEHREIRTLDELNPGSARAVQTHLSKALADKIAR